VRWEGTEGEGDCNHLIEVEDEDEVKENENEKRKGKKV